MSRDAIQLQKQPTRTTCVHTCLAMMLGVPVELVIKKLGENPMGSDDMRQALDQFGIVNVQLVQPRLVIHGWHTACVPSLNIRGGNHQILIHNDMESGRLTVRDPSTLETYAENGSDLKAWSELIVFHPGGRLNKPNPTGEP